MHARTHAALLTHSQNEEDAYRKMRLRVEDVQGRNCLTNFWVSGCEAAHTAHRPQLFACHNTK
jgi:ribosomal protein S3AE